ncbi:hypothetical protein HY636_03440 [Candidatus Woesearchaeota archaeon]|nr:hypothetical protein [Candidatus Woesearchaeota archaeon]
MNNVLVVYKKSAYEIYKASSDIDVVKFVSSDCSDAVSIRQSHDVQMRSLDSVLSVLSAKHINFDSTYRADITANKLLDKNLVISVGGDGTFLEVSHYVKDTLLLGVNSDPEKSTGFFCCSNTYNFADNAYNFEYVIDNIENTEKVKRTKLARMELKLDGKILPELVLNDILVAHQSPAANTRCRLITPYDTIGHKDIIEHKESGNLEHKGSGILVCTAAGSSAFMYNEEGSIMDLSASHFEYIERGVRNAQPHFAEELTLTSLTRALCIFIDGHHLKYDFPLGKELYVTKGQPLNVIGDLEEKRK